MDTKNIRNISVALALAIIVYISLNPQEFQQQTSDSYIGLFTLILLVVLIIYLLTQWNQFYKEDFPIFIKVQ